VLIKIGEDYGWRELSVGGARRAEADREHRHRSDRFVSVRRQRSAPGPEESQRSTACWTCPTNSLA